MVLPPRDLHRLEPAWLLLIWVGKEDAATLEAEAAEMDDALKADATEAAEAAEMDDTLETEAAEAAEMEDALKAEAAEAAEAAEMEDTLDTDTAEADNEDIDRTEASDIEAF